MSETLAENPTWSFANAKYFTRVTLINTHAFLEKIGGGFTLNMCCGNDSVGDVKCDIDGKMLRQLRRERVDKSEYVVCDARYAPFRPKSFDTVICDPPFGFYNKFKWMLRLSDLARHRLILSHPLINVRLGNEWVKELYSINGPALFLRLWSVFTRKSLNSRLDNT